MNNPQTTVLPDFALEAQASGAAVLACWPHLAGWHHAVWTAPHGCEQHWCIEERWTPGADPSAFLPMPEMPS